MIIRELLGPQKEDAEIFCCANHLGAEYRLPAAHHPSAYANATASLMPVRDAVSLARTCRFPAAEALDVIYSTFCVNFCACRPSVKRPSAPSYCREIHYSRDKYAAFVPSGQPAVQRTRHLLDFFRNVMKMQLMIDVPYKPESTVADTLAYPEAAEHINYLADFVSYGSQPLRELTVRVRVQVPSVDVPVTTWSPFARARALELFGFLKQIPATIDLKIITETVWTEPWTT